MFINTPGSIDPGVSGHKTSLPIICTVNLNFCLNAVYKCAKTWSFGGQVGRRSTIWRLGQWEVRNDDHSDDGRREIKVT